MSRLALVSIAAIAAAAPAYAQDHDHHGMDMKAEAPAPAPAPAPTPAPPMQDHDHHDMAQETAATPMADHGGHAMPPMQGCRNGTMNLMAAGEMIPLFGRACNPLNGSGTSRLPPEDGGGHGIHKMAGDWMVMLHGNLWGVYTDQGGPRGDRMAFVESMAMAMAERRIGDRARVQLRTMLSLEPLMGAPGYPNLFATGETAGGQPLVDRQHPHDLFMELAGRIDLDLGANESLFVYGGPVAEPALGPSAFMHRGSARYLALAPITHHWFDSTHITYGVVTAGYAAWNFQIEASAFRGREPDEERWGIETPKLDSWSVRASYQPSTNWLAQVSYGRLESPEVSHPGDDEGRFTTSVHYADQRFNGMLAFSAKKRIPGDTSTAWLAEGNYRLGERHNLFGRIENVANDELFPDHSDPLHDQRFRVTRFEAGYAYRLPITETLGLALGGSGAAYAKPGALDAAYGTRPLSYTLFAKLSLGD